MILNSPSDQDRYGAQEAPERQGIRIVYNAPGLCIYQKGADSSSNLYCLDHHPSLREEPSKTVLFVIRSRYFGPRCVVVVYVSI